MSLLGEDFNVFRIVVWHCMNLIDGRIRLIPYFDLLIIRLLKLLLDNNNNNNGNFIILNSITYTIIHLSI